MKISKNFTLEEFTESEIAKKLKIDNSFEKPEYKANVMDLVSCILQPLRSYLETPIHINSGYRCKELNRVVGGVYNSQHMTGKAADFVCKDMKRAAWAIENLMNFDQLIIYRRFIHVSYNYGNNRKEIIYKNI